MVSTFFTYINTAPAGAETKTLEATYYKLGVNEGAHVIQLPFDASAAMHTYAIAWLPNSIVSWLGPFPYAAPLSARYGSASFTAAP